MATLPALERLPHLDAEGKLRVVVEAPKGAVMKLRWQPELGAFEFHRALPHGVAYPFDWGFVPSTRAEDGDPLDAMVLLEEPTWPGVVIATRPIGVLVVSQRDEGEAWIRNDRLIAVQADDDRYDRVEQLSPRMREDIERFFVIVGKLSHDDVVTEGWRGPERARSIVDAAARRDAEGG